MVHGGSDLCAGVLRKGPIVCQIAIINSKLDSALEAASVAVPRRR